MGGTWSVMGGFSTRRLLAATHGTEGKIRKLLTIGRQKAFKVKKIGFAENLDVLPRSIDRERERLSKRTFPPGFSCFLGRIAAAANFLKGPFFSTHNDTCLTPSCY